MTEFGDRKVLKTYFTWADFYYRKFINELIMILEPIQFGKNEILINELEEFNQIYFIRKGHFLVGYEMNKEKKYCLSFKNNQVAYGMTFLKRSEAIYKTKSRC